MGHPLGLLRPYIIWTGLALLIAVVSKTAAQTPAPALPVQPLHLADCLALSEQRQPSLTVARARLAAAQTKVAALDNLSGPAALLSHDLPVRRQQARLGVDIARADVARLDVENRYVVTRAISRCCIRAHSGRCWMIWWRI